MSLVDKEQWIELYTALEKPLYNVVYRMLWDAAESQDVVQEAFLRCWKRRTAIRADGLQALLFRTALNLASNRRRRGRLWRFVGLDAAEAERPGDDDESGPIPRRVREAIENLPERLKHALLLTEMAGMTYAEVATTLGVSEGTVGSRRTRALGMLRRVLQVEQERIQIQLMDGKLL